MIRDGKRLPADVRRRIIQILRREPELELWQIERLLANDVAACRRRAEQR
jgi:hypothetical protein